MRAEPDPSGRRRVGAWAALLLAGLAGCAGLDRERHLAPLYSEISSAGGGVETEALGGAVLVRRDAPRGRFTTWGVRPLFLHHPEGPGRSETDFLVPLGRVRRAPEEHTWALVPLARYSRVREEEGERWSFLSLLGIYFAGFPDGRRVRAWFPFAGVVEGNLTFDRLDWVLFPLYARSVRQGRTSHHVLWPIFAWGRGEGMGGWRVFPLLGHTWREGSYDRWYALWPVFQWHDSNLKASDPELHRHDRQVFPLFSFTRQGGYRAYGFLWPFFGWAHDEKSGFWAWDGPWPLVRVSRPGEDGRGPHRTRFWPLYGHYRGDGLDQRTFLWPLVTRRRERYPDGARDAWNVVPFWQSWDRTHADGRRESWRKAWPLFQRYRLDDRSRFELVSLHPFWRLPRVDLHYGWLWELYTRETEGPRLRERSWLGLYKRERDRDEDRVHLGPLWSRRDYSRRGERVREQSLLFGLLRWRRSASGGLRLLRPALPGPGWPLERMPNSLGTALDAEAPGG